MRADGARCEAARQLPVRTKSLLGFGLRPPQEPPHTTKRLLKRTGGSLALRSCRGRPRARCRTCAPWSSSACLFGATVSLRDRGSHFACRPTVPLLHSRNILRPPMKGSRACSMRSVERGERQRVRATTTATSELVPYSCLSEAPHPAPRFTRRWHKVKTKAVSGSRRGHGSAAPTATPCAAPPATTR